MLSRFIGLSAEQKQQHGYTLPSESSYTPAVRNMATPFCYWCCQVTAEPHWNTGCTSSPARLLYTRDPAPCWQRTQELSCSVKSREALRLSLQHRPLKNRIEPLRNHSAKLFPNIPERSLNDLNISALQESTKHLISFNSDWRPM